MFTFAIMACAALKRSSDWENMNHTPRKRRRCNPFEEKSVYLKSKSRSAVTTATSSGAMGPSTSIGQKRQNPFSEANIPVMTSEQVSQNICNELLKINKRRKLSLCDTESIDSELFDDNLVESTEDASTSSILRPSKSEKPLFTFRQVRLICERMLREREEELCEKYNTMLTSKLAEQYDMFVKFTYDQIQKRYNSVPSYLS